MLSCFSDGKSANGGLQFPDSSMGPKTPGPADQNVSNPHAVADKY